MLSLRRILVSLVLLMLLVVGVGAAGWWFLVREDNELATSAPDAPSDLAGAQATRSPVGGGLTFRIIPERSEAAYFTGEKLARLPLPSTAKGSTTAIEGEFHLTEDGLALDPERVSQFKVDVRTLKSDEDRRDNRVQDALETQRFPFATFTASGVTGYDASLSEGAEQTMQLTGTLDLHGVQKDVTWELKARRDGNVITGLATINFKFDEFNITEPNIAGFVNVGDNVTLQVQVVAQAS